MTASPGMGQRHDPRYWFKIPAPGGFEMQPSPSSGLLLLSPKGEGTLRGNPPAPLPLCVPVGSCRENLSLCHIRPGLAGLGSPAMPRRLRECQLCGGESEAGARPACCSSAENAHTRACTHTCAHTRTRTARQGGWLQAVRSAPASLVFCKMGTDTHEMRVSVS